MRASLSARGPVCGKTTVLTERYLATAPIPRTPAPAFSAVAMTFTEKAARELRKRIRDRAYAQLEEASDDTAVHWRDVVRSLEAAPHQHVSTSSAWDFCAAMPFAPRLIPISRSLDATIASVLRARRAGEMSAQAPLPENDPDLVDLAVEYGMARVRDGLDILMDQRGGGRSQGMGQSVRGPRSSRSGEDVWTQKGRKAAWRVFDRGRAPMPAMVLPPSRSSIRSCASSGHACSASCSISMGKSTIPNGSPGSTSKRMVPLGVKKELWPSLVVNEQCKAVLESFRKAIKKWEELDAWDESASLKAAGHSLQFARLALQARRAYEQAKRARGGLDFDDLIVMTRDLLRLDAGSIRDDPESPTTFLLVDEFQDTDSVQNEILGRMSGDALETGGVFVVGDFKQSIYGFRGARPGIFAGLRESFPPEGRLSLSENFRSVPGVLDFVNALLPRRSRTKTSP